MLKNPASEAQVQAFVSEIKKVGANVGCVILADQTLRDYRGLLDGLATPHLLVWGADEKVVKLASGDWLHDKLVNSELHVFDDSGHCPMWEESAKFNDLLTGWIARR
jgi:pimeloyl-ACP methyl ester carboxylesterase